MKETIRFHGIEFYAAECPKCVGHLKIWPKSALKDHIRLQHGEETKPKRRGKGGRAYGTRNRKSMNGTGIEKRDNIHAA